MRARRNRFRPCVDFRPGLDLLMPRIAPSDISQTLITDPSPVPDGSTSTSPTDTNPYVIPPATVNTLPNGCTCTSTTDPTLTACSPASTSTQTYTTC